MIRYGYATVALPTLTPKEACIALGAAGFSGVEWRVGEAPHGATSSASAFLVGNRCTLAETVEDAVAASRAAEANGLAVIGLSPYVQTGDLAALDQAVAMARAAGTDQIRLQAPRFDETGRRYSELFVDFEVFLAEAVPRAAEAGVRLALELHHRTIVPSVGLAMPLLRRHPARHLGVIYDVGNLVHEGYEDYRIGFDLLGEHLHHVHLKNVDAARDADGTWAYRWAPIEDGLVDAPAFLTLLHEWGYEGWVSIEDLTFGSDSLAGIAHNAAALTDFAAPGWDPPAGIAHPQRITS